MMNRQAAVYCLNVLQCDVEEPTNYNVEHSLHNVLASKYHILYIKVSSLQKRMDDLELFVHDLNKIGREIYVIALTEINITEEATKYYNLPDYNSYFSTNTNGQNGVALLIHKTLPSGIIACKEDSCINCLIANVPKLNINVGVLYKQPHVPTEGLIKYYDSILNESQRTILVGNMNIDLLNADAITERYTNAVSNQKFSILNKIDRDFATSNASIVDHILSNIKKFKYSISLCNARTISNQKIMILGFDDNKPKVPLLAEPNQITYNRINYRKFNQHFSQINLRRVRSIDHLVSMLIDCKLNSIETVQRPNRNLDKPWIYKRSLSRTQRFNMRSQTYAQRIDESSGDAKRHWNTVMEILTNKPFNRNTIDAIQNRTNQIVSDKGQIANIFNGYFLNIGKNLDKRIAQMTNCDIPLPPHNPKQLTRIFTTEEEVLRKIQSMKRNNNLHDSIISNTLVFYSDELAPILASHFNDCFRRGKYPNLLKTDRIVPAFKSKDPLLPKNYRPISIPHNLSKIMESIICDRIKKFCHQNDIIAADQYGFQKNSSAMSAVIAVVDHIQTELDDHRAKIAACLFIDLKKASNTIHHGRFLEKLHLIGIRGELYKLIADYLHNRRQFVDIGNVLSETLVNPNQFSIPQGSALGPLFFLLYINDIFQMQLHGKLILFADDTAIVYTESNPDALEAKMQRDLKILNRWFTLNSLTLNTDKTKAMVFNATDVNLPRLVIRNETIEFVQSHKYLGIHLQSNLKWNVHIDKIVKDVRGVSAACRKICHPIDRDNAFGIYQKLVYNRLSKMAAIYGIYATTAQMNDLQTAQDDAIAIIFAGGNRENLKAIYTAYRLLNVSQIRNYNLAVLMYRYFDDSLKLNRLIKNINGRNILSVGNTFFKQLNRSLQNAEHVGLFKANFRAQYFN